MKHRVFAPAVGLLAVAFAAAGMATQARAADPSGIWAKDDGSAKLEVKKCGRGICSKIVWLKDPNDSRGRPLRDARNENPAMRDRPIMGLQLFSNMVLTAPNTWVGNVYNPEEGRVYTDVKVTMVSRQQLVLRGCRTWLLCGEKSWTRSKLPAPTEPEPIEVKAPAAPETAPPEPPATREETIDANATPNSEAPVAEAARETEPEMARASASLERAVPAAVAEPRVSEAPKMKITKTEPSYQHTAIGFGFGLAATNQDPMPLSGDNVSSMMVMSRPSPLAPETAPRPHSATPAPVETALQEDGPAPAPVARPKPKPRVQAVQAEAAPVAPATRPKPKPRPVAREPQEKLPWLQ
jgi:uncharacterized protein (DUF2147 family)